MWEVVKKDFYVLINIWENKMGINMVECLWLKKLRLFWL